MKSAPTSSLQLVSAIGLTLLQLVCMIFFGRLGMDLEFNNRIDRFAVQGDENFRVFRETFGSDSFFLICVAGNPAFSERLPDLAEPFFRDIAAMPLVKSYHSRETLGFQKGVSSQTGFPFYLRGKALYTAIFQIREEADQEAQLESLYRRIEAHKRRHTQEISDIVLAGEPVVNYQLNLSSQEVKNRLFPMLILMALFFLGVFFRRPKVFLVVLFSIVSSLTTVLGIMKLSGASLNLITTMIPSLVFVLALAMQVHLLISIAQNRCIKAGIAAKWRPNLMVTTTTSIGFGALMTSAVEPIAEMGMYMSLGMWVILLCTHLTHWGFSKLIGLEVSLPTLSWVTRLPTRVWYNRLIRAKGWLVIPLLIIITGFWVLLQNPTESNGLNYFEEKHVIRQASSFVESRLTGASHMEILLSRPRSAPDPATYHPPWQTLASFEDGLLELPDIRHLISLNQAVDIAESKTAGEGFNPVDRDLVLGVLAARPPPLLSSFFSTEYYRIQLLVNAIDKEKFNLLVGGIEDLAERHGFGDHLLITGTLTRILRVQDYLLKSLSGGLLISLITIILLLFIMFRGKCSLAAILVANLFPLGVMACAMGLLQIPTSVATAMVFSIAFGIAVDDSIHFLCSFQAKRERGFHRAWQETVACDGRAVTLTTISLVLGFLVLTLSDFLPTRTFGGLMALGMSFALISDLWFLPSILGRTDGPPD